jgi:hypothetical protein
VRRQGESLFVSRVALLTGSDNGSAGTGSHP